MTWTTTGSWLSAVNSSSLAMNNQAVGNLVLVETVNWTNKTAWISNITGGGCTWQQVTAPLLTTAHNYSVSLWAGTVTATGAATATLVWNTTTPGGYQTQGREFHSSVGSWSLDKTGTVDSAGTNTWPTLTPAGSGELYWGYCNDEASSAGTSTSGFVGNVDSAGCLAAYNLNVSAPTGLTTGDANNSAGIMVLMAEGGGAAAAPPGLLRAFPGPAWRLRHYHRGQPKPRVPVITMPFFSPDVSITVPVATAAGTAPGVAFGSFLTQVLGSGSGLYLADGTGKPWMFRGDFCWALITNAGQGGTGGGTFQQDFDNYLATRASQGFNTIYCTLLGDTALGGPFNNGNTFDGVSPWSGGVIGSLNNTYWSRVDYMIASAASKGITCMLNVAPTECFPAGHALGGYTLTQLTNYGAALASRYATASNIFWAFGDDYFGSYDTEYTNILNALRSGGDTHLCSVENFLDSDSRYYAFNGASAAWGLAHAQVNWVYNYNAAYDEVEYGYTQPNNGQIPVAQLDGTWETGGAAYMRNLVWWVLTSGSRGYVYGRDPIAYTNSGFISQLTTGGGTDLVIGTFYSIFTSWANWHQLVPDTSSALVTAGRGTHIAHKQSGDPQYAGGNTYVSASKNASGSLAVAYLPAANTTTITVNTALLATGWAATWVDPVNGATSAAGSGPTYTHSGANSAAGTDWLLVFQVPSAVTVNAGIPTATGVVSQPVAANSCPVTTVTAAAGAATSPAVQVSAKPGIPTAAGAVTSPAVQVSMQAGIPVAAAAAPVAVVTAGLTVTAGIPVAAAAAPVAVVTTALNVTAGVPASAGAAPVAVVVTALNVTADIPLAAGVASQPVAAPSAAPVAPAVSGVSAQPVASAQVLAGAPAAAGIPVAPAVTTGTAVTAPVPASTGTAPGPVPLIQPVASIPAALAAAAAATAATGASVTVPAAATACTAPSPVVSVQAVTPAAVSAVAVTQPAAAETLTVPVAVAAGAVTAPVASVRPSAVAAAASVSAQPVVSAQVLTTAPAAAGVTPAASVGAGTTITAPVPAAAGTAATATVTVLPAAGIPVAATVATQPVPRLAAAVTAPAALASAPPASVAVTATAPAATGVAAQPVSSLQVLAGVPAAAGVTPPTLVLTGNFVTAGIPAAAGTSTGPVPSLSAQGQAASSAGSAVTTPVTPSPRPVAPAASGAVLAGLLSVSVSAAAAPAAAATASQPAASSPATPQAGAATATGTAPPPQAVTGLILTPVAATSTGTAPPILAKFFTLFATAPAVTALAPAPGRGFLAGIPACTVTITHPVPAARPVATAATATGVAATARVASVLPHVTARSESAVYKKVTFTHPVTDTRDGTSQARDSHAGSSSVS